MKKNTAQNCQINYALALITNSWPLNELSMKFSRFGTRFTRQSGILQLMDDLGRALSTHRDMLMLGGGNPAHIPEVQVYFRQRMNDMLNNPGEFERAIGNYDSPQGNSIFIDSLADMLRKNCGWDVGPENIALTTGSQSSFFYLFNLLGGQFDGGREKQILFPMVPEYIGYSDLGIDDNLFTAVRPIIEHLDDRLFKYRVDFNNLKIDDGIGAICISRPTNPTGNVVTDKELQRLAKMAESQGIPLIIDNAYGLPFPNILFTEANPLWNDNVIVCMSLSKLGLPGGRTGIVVANEEIIQVLSNMTAILNLAPGGLGPILAQDLVATGDILRLSHEVIQPFYQSKAKRAVSLLQETLKGIEYYIHNPEGAIFLWLWLDGVPIDSQQLYERLKKRGVLVVPGHYFFPGLEEEWRHRQECLRITYSQSDEIVERGIKIIGEVVRAAYEIT